MKIAIVGTCLTSRFLAPFDNKDFEIWAMNYSFEELPRVTRIFDLHSVGVDGDYRIKNEKYKSALKKAGNKVWLTDKREEFPEANLFPYKELVNIFGPYFTSSVSWLIAYAIYINCTELAVYGVDLDHKSEYANQKPCVEHYLGIARGKGIKIYIPETSSIMKAPYLYGIEEKPVFMKSIKAKQEVLWAKRQAKIDQIRKLESEVSFYNGALDLLENIENNWR